MTTKDGVIGGSKVNYGEWHTVDYRTLLEHVNEAVDIHVVLDGGGVEPFIFRAVKKDLKQQIEEWGDIPEYQLCLREDEDYALQIHLQ